MATTSLFPNAPDVSAQDYCVIGLATCFTREDGEVSQVQVVEPIPSSALEAILKGVPTSYQFAYATTLGAIFQDNKISLPAEFPTETQIAENFSDRAIAAVRTYKNRPQAQEHISIGNIYRDLNFSIERKRILNAENIVTNDDNVKQHTYTHQVL